MCPYDEREKLSLRIIFFFIHTKSVSETTIKYCNNILIKVAEVYCVHHPSNSLKIINTKLNEKLFYMTF